MWRSTYHIITNSTQESQKYPTSLHSSLRNTNHTTNFYVFQGGLFFTDQKKLATELFCSYFIFKIIIIIIKESKQVMTICTQWCSANHVATIQCLKSCRNHADTGNQLWVMVTLTIRITKKMWFQWFWPWHVSWCLNNNNHQEFSCTTICSVYAEW